MAKSNVTQVQTPAVQTPVDEKTPGQMRDEQQVANHMKFVESLRKASVEQLTREKFAAQLGISVANLNSKLGQFYKDCADHKIENPPRLKDGRSERKGEKRKTESSRVTALRKLGLIPAQ